MTSEFTDHQPVPTPQERKELIDQAAQVLSFELRRVCPPGEELDNALARLQEAMMWAHVALTDGGESETEAERKR